MERIVPTWLFIFVLAISLAACGSDVLAPGATETDVRDAGAGEKRPPPEPDPREGTAMEQPPGAGDTTALLRVSQGSPSYVVDSSGASVYYLRDNYDGTRCDGVCEGAWPPVMADDAQANPGPGLDPSLVGVLQRADGRRQVTYARHPLYRYAGDSGAGRTSGHQVQDKWGRWSLIAPSGQALTGKPAAENQGDRAEPARAPQ